jgi:transcriptional regulator GlxA family with amidase domain
VRSRFLELLIRLARVAAGESPPGLGAPPGRGLRDELATAAVRTIDLHFSERLRVRDLAALAHLSADHFTEVFSSVVGCSPRDYIRHVRVERAKALLGATSISVSEIARMTGFSTHPQFTQTFRTVTGTTPRDFRRRAQSQQTG